MRFRKYQSIENTSRAKTVNYIMDSGNSDGEWVLTLKIHGANYSFYCDGEDVKRGRKTDFLVDETFYGDFNFDYSENIKEMYKFIKENISTMETLTVYGEIYGGLYNHPDVEKVQNATQVMKQVQYRPDNAFAVIDIRVDDDFLDHDAVISLCMDFGFDHAPELARGKFVDLMKFPVVFPDPLSSHLGLPEIEDNDAEGWVLKPLVPKFFDNGNRIILKGKSPKFCEKNGGKGKNPAKVIELSDEGNRLKDELLLYLNDNRLRNVLSHIGTVTQKDFGRLLGMLCQDAFGDFSKNNGVDYEALSKKERNVIKKNMNREAGNVIRPNFLNIIDGEF